MTRKQTIQTSGGKKFPVASCIAKGAAAASVAGLVFAASPAHSDLSAGAFVQQLGVKNPLKAPVDVSMYAFLHPTFADIDGDGDFDMFVGGENVDSGGDILFFENTGTDTTPVFVERTGTNNPFYGKAPKYAPAPAFADLDGDGDLDAVGGEGAGYGGGGAEGFFYFDNTGTETAPAFTMYWGGEGGNPFGYTYPEEYSTPVFVDIDGDGDMDLFAGKYYGGFDFFENYGSATEPNFSSASNPFGMTGPVKYSAPAFADIDGDGDMDAVMGEAEGNIHFFENTGTGGEADFEHYYPSETENPFYGQNVGYYNSPAFVDMDGDGDMDLVAGSRAGYSYDDDDDDDDDEGAVIDETGWRLNYFENVGTAVAPAFVERTGTQSPFTGFDVGYLSTPTFVDIDGDGDLDAFSGERGFNWVDDPYGDYRVFDEDPINFFENVGTTSAPAFVDKSNQADNPFYGINPELYSFAAFADIDGDGDMDAFIGGFGGEDEFAKVLPERSRYRAVINYLENTGTATDPEMSPRINDENPLDAANNSYDRPTALAFVDIDGDGDLDAFMGHRGDDGMSVSSDAEAPDIDDDDDDLPGAPIKFYQNIGSAQNPILTPDDNGNPLSFVYANVYSMAFVDVDGDGDMDVVVGEVPAGGIVPKGLVMDTDASLQLYENVGGATAPAFAPLPKVNDLFEKMIENSSYDNLYPAFADIDGDGDLDIFAGEAYGRFLFIENQTPIPEPDDDDDDDDDDDNPVLVPPADDDDTCFVDTAAADAGPSFLTRTAKSIYDAVTSIFR